ncbi:radical SAM protein [Granulosicoccus sp.]|nr:radical SAM protein [Granulosicoccus sp.]MDB4223664.1 radical SAM protein [Granulosicoccus sp.]
MKVRSKSNIILRHETFGASVYVPERDDIFLLDENIAKAVKEIGNKWAVPRETNYSGLKRLASLGIIDASGIDGETVPQNGYSGVHLIGDFPTTPIVKKPLLVNCFATSWCPLKCVYCHADDLMDTDTRRNEEDEQTSVTAKLATRLDALVYVVTGGDPITRPKRTIALLKELPPNSAIVLDTSGVGHIEDLIAILKTREIHLRVSIDSMDPKINNMLRPINKKDFEILSKNGSGTLDYSTKAIEIGHRLGTGVSIQTVITKHNDSLEHLLNLRDWLYSRGVKNWILHVATNAGKANKVFLANKKKYGNTANAGVFPDPKISGVLRVLVERTTQEGLDMDIRTTNASPAPNSVFLLGSVGSLFVQSYGTAKATKRKLEFQESELDGMWGRYSDVGHVSRYTNLDMATEKQHLSIKIEFPLYPTNS